MLPRLNKEFEALVSYTEWIIRIRPAGTEIKLLTACHKKHQLDAQLNLLILEK